MAWQPVGLGDHPNASLGPVLTHDNSTEVAVANVDRLSGCLLGAEPTGHSSQQHRGTDRRGDEARPWCCHHRIPPSRPITASWPGTRIGGREPEAMLSHT